MEPNDVAGDPGLSAGQAVMGSTGVTGAGSPGGISPDLGGSGGPPATPPASASPQVVALSPDTIKSLIDQLPRGPVASPQHAQPQMSPEQLEQMLNVHRVNDQDLAALGYPPEQVEQARNFFNQNAEKTVRWASTLAALQVEQTRRQMMTELAPVIRYAQQMQERELRQEFITRHEDLKGYEPLLEAVYQQLQSSGQRYPDKDSAFTAVATMARELIRRLPGQGGGAAQPARTATKPKMATVTTGGQSSGGGGTAITGEQALARKLFFNSRA